MNAISKTTLSGLDMASYLYHLEKKTLKAALKAFVAYVFGRKITIPKLELIKMIWPNRDAHYIKSYLKSREITNNKQTNEKPALPIQKYNNSCGAQSLRQAAYELGVTNLPSLEKVPMLSGQSIGGSRAEHGIYNITGNLYTKSLLGQKVEPEYGGESFPHNILLAIKLLELDGRFYCSSIFSNIAMQLCRRTEWFVADHYSNIHHRSPPPLCNNERLMVIINVGSKHHYIMQRPDGTCYDPAFGKNFKTMEQLFKEYKKTDTSASRTGISILICEPNNYPKPHSFS